MEQKGIGEIIKSAAILSILILACLSTAQAKTRYYLLEPTHVSFDSTKIKNYREPYLPEYSVSKYEPTTSENTEYWLYGAAFNIDVNLIRINDYTFFFKNKVHMDATTNQVRRVGWEYFLGVTLVPNKLELFTHHHSEHWLEGYDSNRDRFPVKDEYTLRFIFLNK